MKLYWGSGSPVSWRAQLALALKGLDYQSHRLDLGNREHRGEAFRSINPLGTFPVLVDEAVTVRDSVAILAYLDRRHPEPPLFGTTPAQAAEIWQTVAEHDGGLGARAATITRALFRADGLADPEPARAAVEGLDEDFRPLETTLARQDWLVGGTPSAAEVVLYPTLHRIIRAAAKPEASAIALASPVSRHPAIGRWLARLASLPGVDATYPPHWRES